MTTIAAEHLADEHAADAIPIDASETAEAPAAVDVEKLIRELDAAYNHLPEEALRACQSNRELVIPRLIDVLRHAVRVGQEGAVRVGNAPIYALFLLAEFEVVESLPVVMDLLKLPHDIPDDLLGESITTYLPRILAILSGDRIDLLDELIRDPQLNDYVRWSAVDAFRYLVRDGRMTRQVAIDHLQVQLSHAISQQDASITAPLIINLLKLNANDARPDIEEAFRQQLVEEFLVNMDCVNGELRPDEPDSCNALECHTPTKITDTIAELRDWHWSGDDISREDRHLSQDIWPFNSANQEPTEPLPLDDGEFPTPYESSTLRRESPRVGRNDPCPCGSGKKYKKCCLRLNSTLEGAW